MSAQTTDRKTDIEQLIRTAELLDAQGHVVEADKLTRLAERQVEQMEDDADLGDTDAPVATDDPFAKGFGRSVVKLSERLDRLINTRNLDQKLKMLCDTKKCDLATARKARRALEDASEVLALIVK